MLRPFLHYTGKTVLLLRLPITVALFAGLAWAMKTVAAQWPDKGVNAFFVALYPALLVLMFFLHKREGMKHRDYWGDPIPTALEYDIDLIPHTSKARFMRAYAAGGFLVMTGLWLWSVWVVVH